MLIKTSTIPFSTSYLPTAQAPWVHCFLNRVMRERGLRYRKAIIICPSGSYAEISERETDAVALRFLSYGFPCFVLRYSTGRKPYPTALLEAAETVATVRKNAEKWDIDPDGIFLCGFSAGGHLAASLAVHWDEYPLHERYPNGECRPNGTILCYPIITAKPPHRAPFFLEQLLVTEDSRWYPLISTEDYVTRETPPCFIWHNSDDLNVSVMNSILYMSSLAQNSVPFEAHIFPQGGHGLSLADETSAVGEHDINPVCAQWSEFAIRWLQRM